VPVLGRDGTAVAAIAVQGPSVRVDDARLDDIRAPLGAAAVELAPVLVVAG
jgi:DNA-binding IclR family transcriptional regulator